MGGLVRVSQDRDARHNDAGRRPYGGEGEFRISQDHRDSQCHQDCDELNADKSLYRESADDIRV